MIASQSALSPSCLSLVYQSVKQFSTLDFDAIRTLLFDEHQKTSDRKIFCRSVGETSAAISCGYCFDIHLKD